VRNRIIPVIQYNGYSVVTSKEFKPWRSVGVPMQLVKQFCSRECDELIFVLNDHNKSIPIPMLQRFSREINVPLTIGGGIKRLGDAEQIFSAGGDKVMVCSLLLDDPNECSKIANTYGSQALVANINVLEVDGVYHMYDHRNQSVLRSLELSSFINTCRNVGVGEVVVSSVSADGSRLGFNIALYEYLSDLDCEIIANGGAGCASDFLELFSSTAIRAAAASSLFCFTQETTLTVSKYLRNRGVNVRVPNL